MPSYSRFEEHVPLLPLFFPSAMIYFLVQHGHDIVSLLADTGLEPGALERPDTRASFKQVSQIITNAEAAWARPALGLHFGQSLTVQSLGMVGQAAAASGTVGDALETIIRYLALRDPLLIYSIEREANGLAFVLNSPVELGAARRFVTEAALSASSVFAMQLAGKPLNGIGFEFQHDCEGETSIYEGILGSKLQFGATRDAFYVPVELLALPIPTASVMSAVEARQYCDAELARLGQSLGLSQVVRTLIESRLGNPPTETEAAKILGHSERNLRRRLANENTNYRELVRSVRNEAAERLLRTTHLGIESIALELGYKNVGNFSRAFKRWTGMTPSGMRRTQRNL